MLSLKKLNYSRSPWRLVFADGRELYSNQHFDHPSLGATIMQGPVCGETKGECLSTALALLGYLITTRSPAASPESEEPTQTDGWKISVVGAAMARAAGKNLPNDNAWMLAAYQAVEADLRGRATRAEPQTAI